jgi:ribose/xylose/arabinose/galactoside ABC-type transport system permease subunit
MTNLPWVRRLVNLVGPFLGLIIVLSLFSWLTYEPGRPFVYLSAENVKKVSLQTTVLATCGLGMTLVIISGGIDLSIGSIVALSNVVVVLVMNGTLAEQTKQVFFRGQPILGWITALALAAVVLGTGYRQTKRILPTALWLVVTGGLAAWAFSGEGAVPAFCAGTLVGLLCGWLNGLFVTATGVVPFIITLGTMEIYRGAVLLLAKETKVDIRAEVRPKLADEYRWLDRLMTEAPEPDWLIVGPGVWILIGAALATVVLLSRLRLGRYVFAIGSNEEAGRLSGLAVASVKRWVYSFSGLAAGLAGVMQFSRLSTGVPTDNIGLELDVIAAVVIGGGSLRGGEGSILGTLIGAFILGFMRNGCTLAGIPNPVQRILVGGIIILAVAIDERRHRKA